MRPVLLVTASAKPGGAERALVGLARLLPDLGWQPTAVLLQSGELEAWLRDAGCPVTLLPAGHTRHLHRTGASIIRLTSLARRPGAVAVLSSMPRAHVFGGLAAAAGRIPAVWWQHGIPRRSRIEQAARRVPAAAVVCVSEAAAAAQRRLTPRAAIVRIHPGSPLAALAAARDSGAGIRRELGLDGKPVVGIVGRLDRQKGQDVVLRAAALGFVVVGGAVLGWEGDYPDELRRLASALGIGERVHFAGHQPHSWEWLDALDIVVHANFSEAFGLVVVEALALGKPVVAAADGGPLEIVEDGRSGLLVPPGDPERLAAAVLRLLEDDALRARLAAAGPTRAELFSDTRMAAEFAALLDRVAIGGPG